MSVLDKKFFTATLIEAAGCSADIFRSWRNRNGLLPETQGKTGWNKFSLIDIFVVSLVVEMTDTGIAAQVAVDAANQSAPILSNIFGACYDGDEDNFEELMFQLASVIMRDKPYLAVRVGPAKKGGFFTEVVLIKSDLSVADQEWTSGGASILLDLRVLARVSSFLWMHDVEFEDGEGRIKKSLGNEKRRAKAFFASLRDDFVEMPEPKPRSRR